jgi:hypothetical protein
VQRRVFLATLIAGTSAGCTALQNDDASAPSETTASEISTSDTSTTTDTKTSMSPCNNGGSLVDNRLAVTDDGLSGFELRVNKETVIPGGTITFRLVNSTESKQMTGVRSKYGIHRRADDGWRSIYYSPNGDGVLYYDLAIEQEPGEVFTWNLKFDAEGLSRTIDRGEGTLAVCTPIRPGTYRFVYWGLTNEEKALGTKFSVAHP